MKNEKEVLASSDQENTFGLEGALQRLLNEKFEGDKANLSVNEASIGPQSQIDQECVKKVLNEIKKGKALGTSGVVSKMFFSLCLLRH